MINIKYYWKPRIKDNRLVFLKRKQTISNTIQYLLKIQIHVISHKTIQYLLKIQIHVISHKTIQYLPKITKFKQLHQLHQRQTQLK